LVKLWELVAEAKHAFSVGVRMQIEEEEESVLL